MELQQKYDKLLKYVRELSLHHKPDLYGGDFDDWYMGSVTQGNADDTFWDGVSHERNSISEEALEILKEIGEKQW